MNRVEFERVAATFTAFHQEFAPLFGRREARQRSEQYLRGLLVQHTDRRNAENVAEAIAGATPRALQRLLTEAPWKTEPVIERLQKYLGPRLSTAEGVFVLDETGFPKKGTQSVGVARQYCGTLGKVGNCQLGVFLAYVSARGHALIDGRLYLPREWIDDPIRCQAAGVPAEVTYQSKAEVAVAMLTHARTVGALAGPWVTADADYGKVPALRDALAEAGWRYVLEVPSTTTVFVKAAKVAVPIWSGHGRKPRRPRLVEGAPHPQSLEEWTAAITPDAWNVLTVAEGAQGPRRYQFVAHRGWESRDGLPGRETWLVARRNLDGSALKYYLSNAPTDTPLLTLGQVGACRWSIETEFQTEKGETGLDEYEVRGWDGWHHHIAFALLAGAFVLTVEQEWGKKSPRVDAPPGDTGAARGTAPTDVDRRRPLAVAA